MLGYLTLLEQVKSARTVTVTLSDAGSTGATISCTAVKLVKLRSKKSTSSSEFADNAKLSPPAPLTLCSVVKRPPRSVCIFLSGEKARRCSGSFPLYWFSPRNAANTDDYLCLLRHHFSDSRVVSLFIRPSATNWRVRPAVTTSSTCRNAIPIYTCWCCRYTRHEMGPQHGSSR